MSGSDRQLRKLARVDYREDQDDSADENEEPAVAAEQAVEDTTELPFGNVDLDSDGHLPYTSNNDVVQNVDQAPTASSTPFQLAPPRLVLPENLSSLSRDVLVSPTLDLNLNALSLSDPTNSVYAFPTEETVISADGNEFADVSLPAGVSSESIYLSSTDETVVASDVAVSVASEHSIGVTESADSSSDSSLDDDIPPAPTRSPPANTLNPSNTNPDPSRSPIPQQDLFDIPLSADRASKQGTLHGTTSELKGDSVVFEEEMAGIHLRKLAGELEGIVFQIEEIGESVQDVKLYSRQEILIMHDDLKELRIQLVKINKEIALAQDPAFNFEDQVQKLLATSKEHLRVLRLTLSNQDAEQEKVRAQKEAVLEAEKDSMNRKKLAQEREKQLAFKRSCREVEHMKNKLVEDYSILDLSTNRNDILRRDKEKGNIAAEFSRMKDLVNRLILHSDCVFVGKDQDLEKIAEFVEIVQKCKVKYEDKVHRDLVENDLTEDKLKLSEATKINVGKFSGRLGVGDDFYTFKGPPQ